MTWVFVVFGVLEVMNVAVLYGAPGSRKANGVGVFTAWERSKADPDVHLLVRYLVYWVAGVKVIFLALLAVIVVTGTERTKTAAGAVLAVSVAVFFWRLFPLARRADAARGDAAHRLLPNPGHHDRRDGGSPGSRHDCSHATVPGPTRARWAR